MGMGSITWMDENPTDYFGKPLDRGQPNNKPIRARRTEPWDGESDPRAPVTSATPGVDTGVSVVDTNQAAKWKEPGVSKGSSSGGGGLIFPTDLGSNATNHSYMGFQPFKITGGIGSAKTDRDYEMQGGPTYLPIPDQGINEAQQQNWGEGEVSMAVATIANSLGRDAETNAMIHAGAQGSASHFLGAIDRMASKVGATSWEGFKKGFKQTSVGVGLELAGRPLTNAFGVSGMKETAQMYNGPAFRSFQFSFSMKPLSSSEQSTIEAIVEFFKTNSMPAELSGELYRIYSLPHVFEIKFYNKGGESQSLPRLGKCALTNITAKYGGDRYSTFTDGRPVQTDLTLSFVEIELQTLNAPVSTAGQGHPGNRGGIPGVNSVDTFAKMGAAAARTSAFNNLPRPG